MSLYRAYMHREDEVTYFAPDHRGHVRAVMRATRDAGFPVFKLSSRQPWLAPVKL